MWDELKALVAEAKLPFELNLKAYFDSIYGGLQKSYPENELRMVTGYYETVLMQIVNELSELLVKSVTCFSLGCKRENLSRKKEDSIFQTTRSQKCAKFWQDLKLRKPMDILRGV